MLVEVCFAISKGAPIADRRFVSRTSASERAADIAKPNMSVRLSRRFRLVPVRRGAWCTEGRRGRGYSTNRRAH